MIIKIANKHLSFLLLFSVGLFFPMLAWGATTPSLGAATTYGVLSSTYTNTTITTINGDVGFTTPPAVAPLWTHPYYGSSSPYSTAGTDQGVALSALNAQWCDFNYGVATDLSLLPQPLVPGVYCIAAAASVGNAWITLDGWGTYIFRIDGTLNTDANAQVTLINSASACDVFWTPIWATTLGANTVFKGTVIGDAGITVGANSSWDGRALSFAETVTTDTTVINNICGATPATLQVIKLVDNTDGGNAISSDFTISVLLTGSNVPWSPASGAVLWTMYALYANTYLVTENTSGPYSASYAWDCSLTGSVVLLPGDAKTCTITNTFMRSLWGSVSSVIMDVCPDGDDSWDSFDGVCGVVSPVSPSPDASPTTWDEVTVTPTSKNVMEPFVFWLTTTQNPALAETVDLPLQLPNSGASVTERNHLLKLIALLIMWGAVSTMFVVELKKYLR
jgi:hypothetical protein